MSLQELRSNLGEFAKDIKLNLGRVLDEDGSPGLSTNQIYSIALACAYTSKNDQVIKTLSAESENRLDETQINAAKAASTIMAMNNIYYRFVHLVSDQDYARKPANLRMNIIANPGVDKVDFELMSLAVSAINGCGMCIDSHVNELNKAGISKDGIQSTIRIASVINATAQALII